MEKKHKQLSFDLFNLNKKDVMEFAVLKFGIKIKCIGKTVYWYDSLGEYSANFDSIVEARKGFEYWCRSAKKGGDIV